MTTCGRAVRGLRAPAPDSPSARTACCWLILQPTAACAALPTSAAAPGVLTVLLLHALPQAAAVGVELQPDAAQLCRDNLTANGLDSRAEILCADLRAHRAVLSAGQFDLVVANPPYFAADRGYTSPDPVRAHARDERTCTMQDICTAMAYLTRWGGSAALVHRPERLSELLCALTAAGWSPSACAPWRARRTLHPVSCWSGRAAAESRGSGSCRR